MAKKRYDSDYMSRQMDERLEQIEERLSALYSTARDEVQAEFNKWMQDHQDDYEDMIAKHEAGDISDQEFLDWCRNHMLRDQRYRETISSLTQMLVDTDIAAMAIVRGELPLVVAESFNFTQALGFAAADEAGLSVGTFQIYNARSVQAILRDNKSLLPEVDIPEDQKWNRTKINQAITQGITNGDSIPKIANRLQSVTNMDRNSAIRNARTCMTGAENLGRNEGYHSLKEKGIPVKMQWSATHDDRTRDTHILLDGTYQNDDGYFGEGILVTLIEYPGDPAGDPEEIYNCRCRASLRLEGIDHNQDNALYEKFMQENYPNDWAMVREQREEKEMQFQANARGAAERVEARRNR